ncbi:MAG: hypothetical protein JW896_06390 [Deltaproteobacteria bacterium]|nr:hypothetical protein [Deltaproteobacteria bacterium]
MKMMIMLMTVVKIADLIPKKAVTRMPQNIKKGIPIPISPHLNNEVAAMTSVQQMMISALGLKDIFL